MRETRHGWREKAAGATRGYAHKRKIRTGFSAVRGARKIPKLPLPFPRYWRQHTARTEHTDEPVQEKKATVCAEELVVIS